MEIKIEVPTRGKSATIEVETDHNVHSVVEVLCQQLGLGDGSEWSVAVGGRRIDRAMKVGDISLRDSCSLELIQEKTVASPTNQKNPFAAKPLCACSRELTWVSQYKRFYCYHCSKYPPTCSICKKNLFWVPEYGRHYCNFCGEYSRSSHVEKAHG